MDVSSLLNSLNDAQRQAVSAPSHSMLVLAGAGSGKTRVLVHRIAWKIQVEGVHPHSILAVTFTNKAAAEMRGRIESLLNISAGSMWIGTFHGIAHRLLRRHAREANLPETFQVMDSDDQLRVIKRMLKEMSVDEKKWPPRQVQSYINAQKDEGLRAGHIFDSGDFYQKNMLRFYTEYEAICNRSGLVDFAELLLRTHETLRDNPELLAHYQRRFRQVHVDEFQDTNTIQYAWLRLLTEGKDNLFVVGDDDQSIYGWRGARVANLLHFQKHYPNHQVIRLEQNYRSTGHILNAANRLIAHNENRMGKELWTDSGQGELISLYTAFNEQDEAYFVIEKIKELKAQGTPLNEIAILYRSNAQSRLFEERLMTAGIPYRVYGGLRFFERAEIKNALAYLRLISNRHDDTSFERVVNFPTRGIGLKTLDEIRELARTQQQSLWLSAIALLNKNTLSTRAANALNGFLLLIKTLADTAESLALHEKVKLVVEQSGLLSLYKNDKEEQSEARVENLEELVNAARLFDYHAENEESLSELDMFLTHAALEAGEMQVGEGTDCVQLMTLHTSKGLEFNNVFLVGLEEGLFPSEQSIYNPERLEEERRLCYVGITRAREQLFISHAESRRLYGQENYPRPSRFLREIPVELLQEIRIRAQITRPITVPASAKSSDNLTSTTYKAGQTVKHPSFGIGVVLRVEGQGLQETVQINFKNKGVKKLMLTYAKLETV
jgi:DNA helicase-2/ATP-dependent DNA helicase PcrA